MEWGKQLGWAWYIFKYIIIRDIRLIFAWGTCIAVGGA
jgi:hypothetical protein